MRSSIPNEGGTEMDDRSIRRARRARTSHSRILISSNARYTTLPSADVLLDPVMVEEILAAHGKQDHTSKEEEQAVSTHAARK